MPKLLRYQPASEQLALFRKRAFGLARQGKHITMTNGERIITIPRANPINSFTMAGIFRMQASVLRTSKIYL